MAHHRLCGLRCALASVVALVLTWAGPLLADPNVARERFLECRSLLDGGQPCQALTVCEAGLAAMDVGNLRALTDEARTACVAAKRSERAKRRAQQSCPPGSERVDNDANACCWPGQTWAGGACQGTATHCVDGFQLDAATGVCSQLPCEDGKVHADDQHCCWPEQVWFEARGRCLGVPQCPAGLQANGEACVPLVPDQDGDHLADHDDQCPTVAEDADGFEDADGCPEYDNDADGICDAYFAASQGTQEGVGELVCVGSDGCPDTPEDADGFEDADGCPDPDNDGDQVADADDLCPNTPGLEAERGCPPPPDLTLPILGWASLGAGTALAATGTGLLLATMSDRDKLNQAEVSLERSDVVLSLTEVEARRLQNDIDRKETAALVTFAVGGPLLLAGATLLVVDAVSDTDDLGVSLNLDPSSGRATVALRAAF